MKKRTKTLSRVLILSLALLMSATAFMFAGCNTTPNNQGSIGGIGGIDKPSADSKPAVYQMAEAMTFSEASTIAELPQGITLQATISPSNAYDKTVDWKIAWVNGSSEWASGKTVTDYMTVTPTSDGALTANVKCLQAFGEQIKITVTSRSNTSKSASCIVDFMSRIASTITVNTALYNGMLVSHGTGTQYNFVENKSAANIIAVEHTTDMEGSGFMGVYPNYHLGMTTPTPSVGTGTKAPTSTITLSGEISDGLKTAMTAQGLTAKTNIPLTFLVDKDTIGTDFKFDNTTFSTFFGIISTDSNWTKLTTAIGNNTEDHDILVKLTITTEKETAYRYLKFKIGAASLVQVSGVTLNNSTLVL